MQTRPDAPHNDVLLDLLARVRSCLMRGDFSPLYAVWEAYGDRETDAAPPIPKKRGGGNSVANELAGILEQP